MNDNFLSAINCKLSNYQSGFLLNVIDFAVVLLVIHSFVLGDLLKFTRFSV